jgi:hypothetical protein
VSAAPSAIPPELRELPQWVRWKLVPDEPKPRKIPIRPADPGCASSTDPATWGTFEDAEANVGLHGTCGLGFVFAGNYVGIDIDNCLTEEGKPDAKAADIIAGFSTYTEVSPGGFGLHMIGRGSLNGHRGMNRNGVELYDRGRYFTMTGDALPGSPSTIAEVQPALDALVAKLDPPRPPAPPPSTRPRRSDDHERLVERARAYTAKMPPAISGQGGHEATFRVALALVKGFALDTGTALDLLREYNSRCDPAWSEKELVHKIEDAGKADVPDSYIIERDEPKARGSTSAAAPAETKESAVLRPVRIADVILEQYDAEAWYVPNLLAVGAAGILSADYGLGKSTILSQFGVCASAGRDFLGYQVTRPLACLYWQAEGSRRLFAGRVRDQARNLELDLNTLPLHFVPRGMDPLPFDSRDFAEFVTGSGCELVFCDTFGYFTDGDENSAKDWKQKVSKPLKAIGRATGISFFLVHHEGKPNEFRKGRHKIRGSSAMGGDSDTVMRLEQLAGDPNGRLLMFDKVKDAPEQPDLTLGFDKTKGLFTREGTGQSTDEGWENSRKQIADMKTKITANLATSPNISGRQLFELTRGRKPTFEAALGELKRDILIIGEPGPHNSVLWRNARVSPADRGTQ